MADKDEFLKEEEIPQEEPAQETEKVKIGEQEYTQEELDRYVKLGKLAQEAEDKYNTKLDRVWPEYNKSRQQVQELETKLQDLEKASKSQPEVGSPEEVKVQALKQAKELGIVTTEDINTYIDTRIEAYKLKEDIDTLVDEAKENGQPVPNPDELLQYMAETGVRNPDKAYKLMFEEQLDSWKEQQLKKIKPKGMETQTTSEAGSPRQPEIKQPSTIEELQTQLKSYLKRAEGAENA